MLDDDAFIRLARGFLGGGGGAFFAQNIHGGIDVALGFRQRLLAIHQACAGHFAELADVGGGNFRHNVK